MDIEPVKKPVSGYEKFIQKAVKVRDYPFEFLAQNPKIQNAVISMVLFILYNWYLGYCIYRKKDHGGYEITEFEWCDGLGFLIIITGLVYLGLFYFKILKPYGGPYFDNAIAKPISNFKLVDGPTRY